MLRCLDLVLNSVDYIAVIDNNKIQEMGSHEELMARNGEYAHMVLAQRIGMTEQQIEEQ